MFAEGLSKHTPFAIGTATIVISGLVMLAWIPLRQRPGIGTIANAILIGIAIDVMLPVLPDTDSLAARYAFVVVGIALVGIGSGLYLTALLGPGPRDGLMTGLHFRTGASLRRIRTLIEGSALLCGFILGGRVGLGTVAFALLVGPAVQSAVRALGGLRPAVGRNAQGPGTSHQRDQQRRQEDHRPHGQVHE